MIEETAVVSRSAEGVAWVQTRRKTACGGCSLNKGCGVSVLEKMLGDRSATLRVIDPLSVQPGDEVIIGIRESALVKGSVAVYIVPLIVMMLFAVIGSAVVAPAYGFSVEGSSIAAGALGFVAGFAWVSAFSRRIKRDVRYQPVILRKTEGGSSVPGRHIPITRI